MAVHGSWHRSWAPFARLTFESIHTLPFSCRSCYPNPKWSNSVRMNRPEVVRRTDESRSLEGPYLVVECVSAAGQIREVCPISVEADTAQADFQERLHVV
jgi:hypothetical protein